MHTRIQESLVDLESLHGVQVLLAIESGSRAWGFASENSDYDVRYVYLNDPDFYLTVHEKRDVIEGPVGPVLDFSGWDLRKALRLAHKSNPTFFEWLSSPIVYKETETGAALRRLAAEFFDPRASLFHYVGMAKHNYRENVQAKNGTVRLKKYLYICRPLLAARCIERSGLQPPMSFNELVACDWGLAEGLRGAMLELAQRKRNGEELEEGPAIPAINTWIECEIPRLLRVAKETEERPRDDWRLDKFLRDVVSGELLHCWSHFER